jgi:hypothetical protein
MSVLLGGLAIGAPVQVRGAAASGEKFVLSGVIIFEEGGGLAWLQEPSFTGDRSVPVRLSESIGPYRLTKILEDRIELQGPAGTVLVPVLNAQTGAGPALAQASPGAAPEGIAGGARQPRADATSDAAIASGRAPSQPGSAPGQGEAPGMRALRDRLDLARRQVEQLQRNPQSEAARLGAPVATGPDASVPRPSASGAPTGAQGGNVNSPAGNGNGQGANPNVVYPPPRQTFQSILGLN